MRYYLIAGERSGDLHGSNLIRGIRKEDPEAEVRGWGGDLMEAQGMQLVKHYRETAFMGFLEVVRNLTTIQKLISDCKKDILAFRPDALILIDYPGFNLRMAAFAKKHGIKVLYYISPKVWAWKERRALTIRRVVDRMYVIFPFEIDFYKKYDYEVEYVGNPLMDAISSFQPNPNFRAKNGLSDRPVIAILPGSRVQELKGMLETMLSIHRDFPEYQWVIAGVSNLDKKLYEPYIGQPGVSIVYDSTYDLLHIASAALVTSGTATLETALFRVPEVVCYRTSGITYQIAKFLIKVRFISLVNLIVDREIVRELIQHDFNPDTLRDELRKILPGGEKRKTMQAEYQELAERVGGPGASEKAGRLMVSQVRRR